MNQTGVYSFTIKFRRTATQETNKAYSCEVYQPAFHLTRFSMIGIKKKRTALRPQSHKSVIPFKHMIIKAHLWKIKGLNNHLKPIANLCFIFT